MPSVIRSGCLFPHCLLDTVYACCGSLWAIEASFQPLDFTEFDPRLVPGANMDFAQDSPANDLWVPGPPLFCPSCHFVVARPQFCPNLPGTGHIHHGTGTYMGDENQPGYLRNVFAGDSMPNQTPGRAHDHDARMLWSRGFHTGHEEPTGDDGDSGWKPFDAGTQLRGNDFSAFPHNSASRPFFPQLRDNILYQESYHISPIVPQGMMPVHDPGSGNAKQDIAPDFDFWTNNSTFETGSDFRSPTVPWQAAWPTRFGTPRSYIPSQDEEVISQTPSRYSNGPPGDFGRHGPNAIPHSGFSVDETANVDMASWPSRTTDRTTLVPPPGFSTHLEPENRRSMHPSPENLI